MNNIDEHFIKRFQGRLKDQLPKHRDKLNLSQLGVAVSLKKSQTTYQRWEATGEGMTNIFILLKVFRILNFSFTEIMEMFELSQPNMDELIEFYQDENIEKTVKEMGLLSYVRNNCTDMNDMLIEKLLDILFAERLKRHKKKT